MNIKINKGGGWYLSVDSDPMVAGVMMVSVSVRRSIP
jgi:hypothetical protein